MMSFSYLASLEECISVGMDFSFSECFYRLLPLTQTGAEALHKANIEFLCFGPRLCLLAPIPAASLWVGDAIQFTNRSASLSGVRVAFYFCALQADEISRAGGIDYLTVVTSGERIIWW